MTDPLQFPAFDPIALQIGPLALRWYALAYIAGLVGGWQLMKRLARTLTADGRVRVTGEQVDDLLTWVTLGVILGGRLGYVLFYKPSFYFANPSEILQVWQGGMAFHGGLLGVILAMVLFARRHKLPFLAIGDMVATVVPLGLLFGRLANFINGELWGRPSDVAWAMVFPHGGPLPRHPSQLYEAALEGLVLLVLMLVLFYTRPVLRNRHGALGGIFLIGYGAARFTVEFFREPDSFLGLLWAGASMGQLLSLPMIAVGVALLVWALRRPVPALSRQAA
ncbi:prolipoprotein diacylglyceryl transferase [Novispirillum itersonii]|uniref:Phosphatidylglycerol--prolipoprotein diacylglyceryl transferase n=1 Tax=Novispirillum itersonii TaxID=189 RepID=A0A7W9ZEI3_NOVIT|nr:prolipoprotein diacylglyceryl transferase [Novispirillum itersonii]MBB6209142.1 phosphatidylglycerol:prolipoprotein diacylglycerol transferase [Novispirillum itersonii]